MNVIEFKSPQPEQQPAFRQPRMRKQRWWQRLWFRAMVVLAILGAGAFFAITQYLLHHREHLLGNLEPLVRKRVIETLSARFNAPVQLDHIDVSVVNGVKVTGEGLRVERVVNTPGGPQVNGSMLSIDKFYFQTEMKNLVHTPTRIGEVSVDGMELHIPPPGQRAKFFGPQQHAEPTDLSGPSDSDDSSFQPKIELVVDTINCNNVKLYVESSKPGKDPLEFDISQLKLKDVGANKPFNYLAQLVNPKPVGDVHATGHFGPWASEEPSLTPIDGTYSFDHADLNTIKGIGGILSSTGSFKGVLDRITIDGQTNTPDFSLDVSDHPVPLRTKFHAIVDGTTGDTYLEPVQAHMLHSDFTARGKVVSIKGKGHDIALDVNIPNARMEDMLQLGVKTSPPLMSGALTMKTKLHIPPGNIRVPAKLELAGNFTVQQVRFNNTKFQDRVDGLSARAQGKPQNVAQVSNDHQAEVSSQMQANFSLNHGLVKVDDLHYQIPGALVLMNGVYSLDGNLFEFKGHVRTDATASQMVTGWKSWLLKPMDRFLKKDGAGLQLPIAISGTEGDVHFGLAMHGTAEENSSQIATDLQQNRQALEEHAKAKRDKEEAQKQQAIADSSTDGKRTRAQKKAEKALEKAHIHDAASQAAQQPPR